MKGMLRCAFACTLVLALHLHGVLSQAAESTPGVAAKVPVSEDTKKLTEHNPGAAAFFRAFDRDNDGFLSQSEFLDAIRISQQQGYLPPNFAIADAWVKLAKTNEGKITMRTFIDFASNTPAHNPPPPVADSATTNVTKPLQNCKEVFDNFDADHNGGLSKIEFEAAMKGKLAADAVPDIWFNQPRNGPLANGEKTMDFETFKVLCKAVTGLPGADGEAGDPCVPNPCTTPGEVCVRDPKQCFAPPCPQFKCVPKSEAGPGPVDVGEYSNCMRVFYKYTAPGRRTMTKAEFIQGIRDMQTARTVSYQFNANKAWKLFDKTSNGDLDIYEFVKFCIAATSSNTDPDRTAKEECWEVFTRFDADANDEIDAKEFLRGMRHAARNGHLPSVNAMGAWCAFNKTDKGTLPVTPFIEFCLKISKNIPVEEQPCVLPPPPTPPPVVVNGTVSSNMTGTVTQGNVTSTVTQSNVTSTVAQTNVTSSAAATTVVNATAKFF